MQPSSHHGGEQGCIQLLGTTGSTSAKGFTQISGTNQGVPKIIGYVAARILKSFITQAIIWLNLLTEAGIITYLFKVVKHEVIMGIVSSATPKTCDQLAMFTAAMCLSESWVPQNPLVSHYHPNDIAIFRGIPYFQTNPIYARRRLLLSWVG